MKQSYIFIGLLLLSLTAIGQQTSNRIIYQVEGEKYSFPGYKNEVTLSGSEAGICYELCKNENVVDTQIGTGFPLSFDGNDIGTYTVQANVGGIKTLMNGNLVVTEFPVMAELLPSLQPSAYNLPNIRISSLPITFYVLSDDVNRTFSELETICLACNTGRNRSWEPSMQLKCYKVSDTEGYFKIITKPNPGENVSSMLLIPNCGFKIDQAGGNPELLSFNVLERKNELTKERVIYLDSVQSGVDYTLLCDGIPVSQQHGRAEFRHISQYGVYSMTGTCGDKELAMRGIVSVVPSFEAFTLSYSRQMTHMQPGVLMLSGSEDSTEYQLLRNNIACETQNGNGGPLLFNVVKEGTYKVVALKGKYKETMSGEIIVKLQKDEAYTDSLCFTVERTYLSSSSDIYWFEDVTYLDGFNRPLQEIQVHASPDGYSDLVIPRQYGVMGVEERTYLPYAKATNNGSFDADAFSASNWQNVYGESEAAYAFAQTDYEASPLNRVVKRTGEGRAWHTQGKGVTTAYGLNAADEVRCYEVADDGTLAQLGYYAAGTLQTVRTTDEDGHTSITYTDNQDREVLSVQTDGSTRLETYKVYDDRGLLRWVLSPEASAQLGSTTDSDVLERLAYNYAYDSRKRMTLKRLPGCTPIYMVYDSRDRLVLSQDGEERIDSPNRWSYSQYDAQGRVVETGELVLSQAQSHEELQRAASKSENYLPSGTRTALQYTDYDSYTSECFPFQATAGYSESYNAYPIGQVTSVKSRRLATDEWETVTTYYDDYARPIQAITAKGQTMTSRVDTEYDFLGNVVKQQETQSGGTTLETVNTYDSRNRLLSSVTTKNKVETSVVKYGYDAVGRLVEKRYGDTVEKLGYNVRGWLTSKESAAFKMQLRYEQPEGGVTACYNGNISEWEWSHGATPTLMYGFAYDGFNRLASANQQQASGNGWAGLAANYVEKGITYDRNGNIRTLQRTAAGNLVDDLIYGYWGNRLVSLSEQVRTSQAGDVYLPGNTASGMYEYDSNGNLTKDSRKGLEYKYNRLNLLEEVWKDGEMKAQYNYLSDGTKVSVRDGSGKNGYDYVGSVVYKVVDGRREFDRAVVGDVHFTANGIRYALTDQLGSVRALIDEDGNVVQQNDYYPFGAKVTREDYAHSDDNRFLFSGKESQKLLDLNAYDFGARMYDAALGRWNTVDPLGEKYVNLSPYNYCVNNPLVYVDPNGEDAMITIEGNVITISLNIVLYGEAANADIARLYEMFLYSRWGNITTFMNSDIEYKIEWDINVLYDAELKHGDEDKFDFNGVNNYMEVIYRKIGDEASYVEGSHKGVIYHNRNDRDGSLSKYSMAHEMGHLLGLQDRYNSSGAATSEKYEGNIMHEVDGIVTPLNMKGILDSSLAKQHILDAQRREVERIVNKSLKPEKRIYYINKRNREYK